MGPRILVVDDDPLQAEAIRVPLVRAGYDVLLVTSGGDALDWLRSQTPDLVILDVVMPGMSGFGVCRRIRERHETRLTPVIFLTARDLIADMREARGAGSDLYLTKPVLASRLVAMVDMFLSPDLPITKRAQVAASSAG